MICPCRSASLLVSLSVVLLFVGLSSERPNVKVENDLISDICSKTRNPALCLEVLKANPRSTSANLKGLGQISIDIAEAYAKQTYKVIAPLINQATDPVLKGRYETCAEYYGDALDNLEETKGFLNSGDFKSLNIYASAASDGAKTCEDRFEGPPAEPRQLRQANQKFEDLCDIILVISNRLPGS